MLIENIKILQEMIKNNVVDKSCFNDILNACNEDLQELLKEFDYHETIHAKMFDKMTREHFEQIKAKQNQKGINPNCAIQETVSNALNALHSFVKRYNIGFIKRADMRSSGIVEVEIPCLITNGMKRPRVESEIKTFEQQLEFLQSEGFVVKKVDRRFALINCDQNHKLIHKTLNERNAKSIKVETRNDIIDRISFSVSILDIYKFQSEPITIELPVTSVLNNDEKTIVYGSCNEILSALSFIGLEEKMKDIICSVVEHHFVDICDVFDFDCTTRRNLIERHRETKEMNQQIKKLEEQMSSIMPIENVSKVMSKIQESISQKTISETGFVIESITIGLYGRVKANLIYTTCPIMYDVDTETTEQNICKSFKNNGGNLEDETLYITDTYENKEVLEKILKNIMPTFDMSEIQTSKEKGMYCMKKVSGYIDTLLPIIQNLL